METHRLRVLLTLAIFVFFFLGASFFHWSRQPEPMALHVEGYPTFGNGNVHLVLFEDFRCIACRHFNEEVFPKIAHHFLDAGRIRYTVVPLAFLSGSKPLANGALCVYHQNPEVFFPFVDALFSLKTSDPEGMLYVARQINGVQGGLLQQCLAGCSYCGELERNLIWAKKLMGDQFSIPALYINGILTPADRFDLIAERIEQLEKRR